MSAAFSFTPEQRSRLLQDICRGDIAAENFVDDVEACLRAFEFASGGGLAAGLPAAIGSDLSHTAHAVAHLRTMLYKLPDDVALLVDLHLLSEGARRRLVADLKALVEPLEDLGGAIVEIERAAASDAAAGFDDRLVRAIAVAYRNRLNRKPTTDESSGFPAAFASIVAFAAERVPGVAAIRSNMTAERLAATLAAL